VPTEILNEEKGPSLPSTVEYRQLAIQEAVLDLRSSHTTLTWLYNDRNRESNFIHGHTRGRCKQEDPGQLRQKNSRKLKHNFYTLERILKLICLTGQCDDSRSKVLLLKNTNTQTLANSAAVHR